MFPFTERGILKIRFERGNGRKDYPGSNCDNCFLCYNPCDPYILVKINGQEVYRTSTAWDNESPNFDATFTSSVIYKDSNIAIEMWDNDAGDTADDLMARWADISIDMLLRTRNLAQNQNNIELYSEWQRQ